MDANKPPVSEGEICTLTIEQRGNKGDKGVAKVEGYIIFVPDTKVGDKVKVKITSALPRFAFSEKVVQD